MNIKTIVISLCAFFFGILIVAISFASANQNFTLEGSESSRKKIYFGSEVLPDHLFYPLVMLGDKMRLKSIQQPEEKLLLQLEYSRRRFYYAKVLINKDEKELAFSTITKSQKYLIQAAVEILADKNAKKESKEMLIKAINDQKIEINSLIEDFSSANKSTLGELLEETEILKTKINETISTEIVN